MSHFLKFLGAVLGVIILNEFGDIGGLLACGFTLLAFWIATKD